MSYFQLLEFNCITKTGHIFQINGTGTTLQKGCRKVYNQKQTKPHTRASNIDTSHRTAFEKEAKCSIQSHDG